MKPDDSIFCLTTQTDPFLISALAMRLEEEGVRCRVHTQTDFLSLPAEQTLFWILKSDRQKGEEILRNLLRGGTSTQERAEEEAENEEMEMDDGNGEEARTRFGLQTTVRRESQKIDLLKNIAMGEKEGLADRLFKPLLLLGTTALYLVQYGIGFLAPTDTVEKTLFHFSGSFVTTLVLLLLWRTLRRRR